MDIDELRRVIRDVIKAELNKNQSQEPSTDDVDSGEQNASSCLEHCIDEKVLTASDLENVPPHNTVIVPPGTIISPLVYDVLAEKKIHLRYSDNDDLPSIALGCDHNGFKIKNNLKSFLTEQGHRVFDFGTHTEDPVDYPEFALKVARAVGENHYDLGIIVDDLGMGSCIVANKVPGVKAANCLDEETAEAGRERYYTNVLILAAEKLTADSARQVVEKWLTTRLGDDTHGRRVKQIQDIELKYRKS